MEKQAISNAKLIDSVSKRWSPIAFASTEVSEDHLFQVLEAARWAPSCFNAQPWSFIIGRQGDEKIFQQLSDSLMQGNVEWASKAPVMILAAAKPNFEHNGEPNAYAWHDIGLALGNLLNQATALGLQAHLMAGFSADALKESLGLGDQLQPVTMIALGHPGNPDDLPEESRQRELAPRSRKSLDEIVFAGKVPNPA